MTVTAVAPPPTSAVPMTPDEVAVAFRAIVNELSNEYIERRDVLEVVMQGLLAKAHTFVLGPPGTAKSTFVKAVCRRIIGARFARLLLDKELPKDEFQGEIDIEQYEAGNGWIRDYVDTVVDAHLAFLDEVGKSGPAVLNRMLTWMEERERKPGKKWEDAPLLSAIGASNELLDMSEGLAAIWDRFLLRIKVDYIVEPANFARLLQSKVQVVGGAANSVTSRVVTTVDLDSLLNVIDNVIPFIPVPQTTIDTLVGLRTTLRDAGIIPSDRRWAASVRLIQASAFFNGRSEVDADDLLILRHVLWNNEGEVNEVRKQVMALGSPTVVEAEKLTNSLDQIDAGLSAHLGQSSQAMSDYGAEASANCNKIRDRLKKAYAAAEKANRSVVPLDAVRSQLVNVRYRILKDYVGLSEDGALAGAQRDLG